MAKTTSHKSKVGGRLQIVKAQGGSTKIKTQKTFMKNLADTSSGSRRFKLEKKKINSTHLVYLQIYFSPEKRFTGKIIFLFPKIKLYWIWCTNQKGGEGNSRFRTRSMKKQMPQYRWRCKEKSTKTNQKTEIELQKEIEKQKTEIEMPKEFHMKNRKTEIQREWHIESTWKKSSPSQSREMNSKRGTKQWSSWQDRTTKENGALIYTTRTSSI